MTAKIYALIFIPVLAMTLVGISPETARARQCSDIFGSKGERSRLDHLIPKMPGIHDRMQEVGITPTSTGPSSGAIHQFVRHPNRRAQAIGGFDIFQERILFAPKWAIKFGLRLDDEMLHIPDVAGLNDLLDKLESENDPASNSLRVSTYSKPGALGTIPFARLWKDRKFIVAVVTVPENYYIHDLLNHGLYGYLALPKPLVSVSANWADFLLDIYDGAKGSENMKLRAYTQELIEDLVSSLDAATESMSATLMNHAQGGLSRAETVTKLTNVFSSFDRFQPNSVETIEAIKRIKKLLPQGRQEWLNSKSMRLKTNEDANPAKLAKQYLIQMSR